MSPATRRGLPWPSFQRSWNNAAGASALTYSGAGTLTLLGSNTYSGPTYVNSGVLALSSSGTNNIASSSTINVLPGATLNVSGLNGGTGGTLVLADNQNLVGAPTRSPAG